MFIATQPLYHFISTGRDTKMFTLRTLMQGYVLSPNGQRIPATQSEYVQNLSTDSGQAMIKAEEYARHSGIRFNQRHDLPDLLDIVRQSAEERAEKAEEFERKRVEEFLNRRQEWHNNILESAAECDGDVFWNGQYKGHKIASIIKFDPEYICWILDNIETPEDGLYSSTLQYQADHIRSHYDRPEVLECEFVGEVGERLRNVNVVCQRATGFVVETPAGNSWVDLYICRDDEGNVYTIPYSGTSWDMEPMKEYHITGTVKAHVDHKRFGKSTKLTRTVAKEGRFVEPVKTPKAKKTPSQSPKSTGGPSKIDRARDIFNNNRDKSRGEIINIMMSELDMSKAGASTYYQKVKS